MGTVAILRHAGVVILSAALLACGGSVGDDRGASSSGAGASAATGETGGTSGNDGTGGAAASGGDVAHCESPEPPIIDFVPTCSGFVPSLTPTEVTFIDRTTIEGMEVHRFRAATDCPFEVEISLPHFAFSADAEPYEMSTWWIQGAGPLGLLAAILRRSGDRAPLLAVASDGNAELVNALLAPFAVVLDGPPCSESGDLVQSVVLRDEAPLSCEEESPSVRLCRDGEIAYRLLDYVGPPGSTDGAVAMGNAELLTPVP